MALRLILSFLSLLTLLLSPSAPAASAKCELNARLFRDVGQNSYLAEFRDDAIFWSTSLPTSPSYLEFRKWAALQPNLDPPIAKVKAELELEERLRSPDYIVGRMRAVEEGKLGSVGRARCLEALLFAQANSLRRQSAEPYEMGALVLDRSVRGQRKLRVYLVVGQGVSVRFRHLERAVHRDLGEGWNLFANMHSHPFSINPERAPFMGYTAPSPSDSDLYLRYKKFYGLEEAWITNGINTFRLKQSQFELYPLPDE